MTTITYKEKQKIIIENLSKNKNFSIEIFHTTQILTYELNSKFVVGFLRKKKAKLSDHYAFADKEAREKYINKEKGYIQKEENLKLDNLKRGEAENDAIQVGTILYSSWGYEQTNIDFYVVTKRTKQFVTIREIKKSMEISDGYNDRGKCTPLEPIEPIGEPMRHKLNVFGGLKLTSYMTANVWDGKPLYWSSYA